MQNKKPAEEHWSHKLEETNSLEGLLLEDKNAAWEKLHNRLQQKPRRTISAWYWAAAAGVLLICSLPLFFTNNKPVTLNNNVAQNATAETAAPILADSEKKNASTSQPILQPEMMLPTVGKQTENPKNLKADNQPKEPVTPTPELVVQQETIQPGAAIAPVENNIKEPVLAVTVPVKPTLRVVHINELGNADPQRTTARAADDGFLKFKIMNQPTYTSTAATAKAISFHISKSSSPN